LILASIKAIEKIQVEIAKMLICSFWIQDSGS